MGTRRKSSGCGAITTRSFGGGSIARSRKYCAQEGQGTQAAAILDAASDAVLRTEVLRAELDGECIRYKDGFHAITAARQMWIPFSRTKCPAEALRIAKFEGIVTAKVKHLDADSVAILLATTLPVPTWIN